MYKTEIISNLINNDGESWEAIRGIVYVNSIIKTVKYLQSCRFTENDNQPTPETNTYQIDLDLNSNILIIKLYTPYDDTTFTNTPVEYMNQRHAEKTYTNLIGSLHILKLTE